MTRLSILVGTTFALLTTTTLPTYAQECACVTDFEVMNATAMSNYAAYPIEIQYKQDLEFAVMTDAARWRADASTTTEECVTALRQYTNWFDDPHLFVSEFPRYTDEQIAVFQNEAERHSLTKVEAVAYLDTNRDSIDPIEGIWYDEIGDIAVIQDLDAGPDQFVGVVVKSSSIDWTPGDV